MTKKAQSVIWNRYFIELVYNEDDPFTTGPELEHAIVDRYKNTNNEFYGTEYECLAEIVRRHPEDNYAKLCLRKSERNLKKIDLGGLHLI